MLDSLLEGRMNLADTIPENEKAARALDLAAGELIAGVAGVDFNRLVWTRDQENDFELSTLDEQYMRHWTWEHLMPAWLTRMLVAPVGGGKQARPYDIAYTIMTIVRAFKEAEKVITKKSLSPMVIACGMEVVTEMLSMVELRVVAIERDKALLATFLRRHPDFAPTFNIYVGYTLLNKQMIQNGSHASIRKMNQAHMMKNGASLRLREVFLSATSYHIKRLFDDAVAHENEFVCDWKDAWYAAFAADYARAGVAVPTYPLRPPPPPGPPPGFVGPAGGGAGPGGAGPGGGAGGRGAGPAGGAGGRGAGPARPAIIVGGRGMPVRHPVRGAGAARNRNRPPAAGALPGVGALIMPESQLARGDSIDNADLYDVLPHDSHQFTGHVEFEGVSPTGSVGNMESRNWS